MSSRPQNVRKYDDINHERQTLLRNESRENTKGLSLLRNLLKRRYLAFGFVTSASHLLESNLFFLEFFILFFFTYAIYLSCYFSRVQKAVEKFDCIITILRKWIYVKVFAFRRLMMS